MSISTYYNKIIEYRDRHDATLSTWANHLIVIFAFFVPVSLGGRQSTLFLIMLVFLLRGNYVGYVKEGLKDKLVQAFVIYFLVHVIWLIGTENFEFAKKVVHQAKFLLYPLLFITLIDRKYIPRILGAFLLGMLISELWSYGIYFEILPPNLHDGHQGTPNDPTPVHHHVHYGFMLAITATLLIQRLLVKNDQLWLKILLGLFFITATANIFINAGRTGYVMFVILVLALFLLTFRRRIIAGAMVSISIIKISLLMAYYFSDTFRSRFDMSVNSVQSMYLHDNYRSSLGTRAFVVLSSKDMEVRTWVFGVGTGDQLDAVKENIKTVAPEYLKMAKSLQHLHNEYLRSILQFGIIGLLAFLYIPYQLFRYPQDDQDKKNMLSILAVAILSFSYIEIVVHGLGALLTVVLLSSLCFRNYCVDKAIYSKMNVVGYAKYGVVISLIELVSWYT
jgi:O-antigen ligase